MNIENQNPNLEYLTHEFISSLIKKKKISLLEFCSLKISKEKVKEHKFA